MMSFTILKYFTFTVKVSSKVTVHYCSVHEVLIILEEAFSSFVNAVSLVFEPEESELLL